MRWWSNDPTERFWLELTDRPDIGQDLKFPKTDDSGSENWRYSLVLEAEPGNVVFHYDKALGVVGFSTVAGRPDDRPIVWAARGTYARERGTQPYERPGWKIPLEGFVRIEPAIDLAELRTVELEIRAILAQLERDHPKAPIYFPFETSSKRPLRMLQGYGFKLPQRVVELFHRLRAGLDVRPAIPRDVVRSRGQGFGSSSAVNRAIERHAMEQAIEYYKSLRFQVLDTSANRPYDLQLVRGPESLTVEVKGTTSKGEMIILTRGEVEHVRSHPGSCVLFVLSGVKVEVGDHEPVASGGDIHELPAWSIDDAQLEAISYFYDLGPRT